MGTLDASYHPHGFPRAGLTPATLRLAGRVERTHADALAGRLARWERARGNPAFELVVGARTPLTLAYELVTAYAALRERYESVAPERLCLAAPLGDVDLANSWAYARQFPVLRSLDVGDPSRLGPDELDALADGLDAEQRRMLRRELWLSETGVRDAASAGAITMSSLFASPRRYRALVRYWTALDTRAAAAGRPRRVPPLATSAATWVLAHEFGHLVDDELVDRDTDAARHVYGAISACVLGEWPRETQWRYHLWHYPSGHAGPRGNTGRQLASRDRLERVIGTALTSYASTSREELFAEAFAAAYCGAPVVKARLSPLRAALRDVGIARRAPARRSARA